MCGRYASARKRVELLEEFTVQRDTTAEELAPDYNVAPTRTVYAVLDRAASREEDAAAPEAAERQLRVVRWGLVPFWAKDVKIGSRMINARAETVGEKPAFRRAFAKRRCLLPADGYYEWQSKPGAAKQPIYITRADGRPLAFAGLYELWRDPAVSQDDEDAWLWTATIITTSAPDELGMIHDRMPMIIDPASWSDWLDPANGRAADLRHLLSPAAASGLTTYPVSTAVNSIRNNGPELIEPLAAGPAAPLAPPGHRTGLGASRPSADAAPVAEPRPAGSGRRREPADHGTGVPSGALF
ncbi:MAG TPA: SOS response-associated peptidase [Streptosporangiaceae bacterium]